MAGKEKDQIPSVTMSSTKKEMLDAYELLKAKLEKQAEAELKPEKTQQDKKEKTIITSAETVAAEKDIGRKIYDLKAEFGRFLDEMAEKIESEKSRYIEIKDAIEIKKKELQEIFEIEKSAFSLAALLDAQKQKKLEFENEMAIKRDVLEEEIKNTQSHWEKEKQKYAEQIKEQKLEEEKRRKREKDEFEYEFKREKELKLRQLNDELEKLSKELASRKETFEKEIADRDNSLRLREETIFEREKTMAELQQKVDQFPTELKNRVDQAVSEIRERINHEAEKNEEILTKGFEGEKNVLKTKIDSLEKLVADQRKQIETLSKQIDNAYGKVQEIAVKAVSQKGQDPVRNFERNPESNK
jgi:phage shock protein A